MKNNVKKMVSIIDEQLKISRKSLERQSTMSDNQSYIDHLTSFIKGLESARDLILNNSIL